MIKSIIFIGDFLVECESHLKFRAVSELFRGVDTVICNFEGVLKNGCVPAVKAGPTVFQHSKSIELLKSMGITACTNCNNHTYDFGEKALIGTEEALRATGIQVLGAESEGSQILGSEEKIMIILACETHPIEIENELISPFPEYMRLFSSKLLERITNAKTDGFTVIVSVHAGLEMVDIPLSNIRPRYRDIVSAGADLVIGHHPHVPQGFETFKGKPIFYSLGNFLFHRESMSEPIVNGMAVRIDFSDSNFKFTTYRISKSANDTEIVVNLDNFDELNKALHDTNKYEHMLDKAKIIHGGIFDSTLPLIARKSLKGWFIVIGNLLIRPFWFFKRRKLLKNLLEKNESYVGLKHDLAQRSKF